MSKKDLFKDEETHKSFAMIGAQRVYGHVDDLYGSDLDHNGFIRITLKESYKTRTLNHDHYFGGKTLFEIDMTPSQFAEFITSLNIGDGIPCTLRRTETSPYIEGKKHVNKEVVWENDITDHIEEIMDSMNSLKEYYKIVQSKSNLTKKDKESLSSIICRLENNLTCNMEFVKNSMKKEMEQIVSKGRMELESCYQMLYDDNVKQLTDNLKEVNFTNEKKEDD